VIGQKRAEELREALAVWHQRGGAACLLTLTIRHDKGQRLASLWDGVAESWSRLVAGKPWERFKNRAGVAGFVRVAETTHSHKNGWHVHLHVLVFLDPNTAETWDGVTGPAQFQSHFAAFVARGDVLQAWRRIVRRKGFDAVVEALDLRPVTLGEAEEELHGYFRKNGWDAAAEMAGGTAKTARRGGRTPMAILFDTTETGNVDDFDLWTEWEEGSHGRRQMTWSRGLKRDLGLLQDLSDQEVAASLDDAADVDTEAASVNQGDESTLVFEGPVWCQIIRSNLLWRCLEVAERAPDPATAVRALLHDSLGLDRRHSASTPPELLT